MASNEKFAMSDEETNAILPDALQGTIVTTAGYGAMKQKAGNGTWVAF